MARPTGTDPRLEANKKDVTFDEIRKITGCSESELRFVIEVHKIKPRKKDGIWLYPQSTVRKAKHRVEWRGERTIQKVEIAEGGPIPQALTVGELAKRAGCHLHQVRHFIDSRKIREISRVGSYRIFSDKVLVNLKKHLENVKPGPRSAIAG